MINFIDIKKEKALLKIKNLTKKIKKNYAETIGDGVQIKESFKILNNCLKDKTIDRKDEALKLRPFIAAMHNLSARYYVQSIFEYLAGCYSISIWSADACLSEMKEELVKLKKR